VIEHIALEIQTLRGMDTGFGRTRSTRREGCTTWSSAISRRRSGSRRAASAVHRRAR
jgi:cyanophycin synthetase